VGGTQDGGGRRDGGGTQDGGGRRDGGGTQGGGGTQDGGGTQGGGGTQDGGHARAAAVGEKFTAANCRFSLTVAWARHHHFFTRG
jgi:hypothetical protein